MFKRFLLAIFIIVPGLLSAAAQKEQQNISRAQTSSLLDAAIGGQKPVQGIILDYLQDQFVVSKDINFGWPVRTVSSSPDGKFIAAAGSPDGQIIIIDAETGKTVRVLNGHTKRVNVVTYSTEGEYIFSGSDDTTIKIWNASTGDLIDTLTAHQAPVESISIFSDVIMVSIARDGTLIEWKNESSLSSVAYAKKIQSIILEYADLPVRYTWSITRKLKFNGLNAVTLTNFEILIGQGNEIKEMLSRKVLFEAMSNIRSLASVVKYDSAGSSVRSKVAAGLDNGRIDLIHIINRCPIIHRRYSSIHTGRVNSVLFNESGDRLISGSDDGTIRIWDVINMTLIDTLTDHAGPVLSIALSPDGQKIISGSADGTLKIWELQDVAMAQKAEEKPDVAMAAVTDEKPAWWHRF